MTFNTTNDQSFGSLQTTEDCSKLTEIDSSMSLIKMCNRGRTLRWADEESNSSLVSVLCLLVTSTEMDEGEKNRVWYQKEESLCHRNLAKNVAKGIRKQVPSSSPESYTNVVSQVYKGCMTSRGPSEIAVAKLAHWSSVGHSRRGLEKWSVPNISKIRQQARSSTIAAVLEQQQMLQHSTLHSDDRAEILRLLSLQTSEISRRFAYFVAKADEMAVRNENMDFSKIRIGSARKLLQDNLNAGASVAVINSAA